KEQKKVMAPLSETKEIEIEKVPENQLKRPKATGWVKEEGVKSLQELEDEKREAFRERMKYKHEEETERRKETVKTTRELPSIPKLGGQTSKTCPSCGKDLDWRYCPYCGEKL
ncbi:MAG: zinc ribbon domain-containing protein, partial [Candidatus Lokiarchaeota archaeon]